MHKHLLMTIGDDRSRFYGVNFVSSFFRNKELVKFTLLYLTPKTAKEKPSSSGREESQPCDTFINYAMESLLSAGFMEENLLVKVKKRMVSTPKDIILEGNRGLYDAVILGRRGTSRLEEIVRDSVTSRILDEQRKAPIWICRSPEPERQNVLLCLDGSEESLHMADHVGFILSSEDQHGVTLLHVSSKTENSKAIFQQGRRRLEENGIPKDRIEEKVISSGKVASTILSEAQHGSFSAVALGYSGKGRKKGLFRIGSVALELIYEITGSVLWIG